MVTQWGMSDRLGCLTFGRREEQIFLDKELTSHKDYSEKEAEEIDAEVKRIVMEQYEYAKELIKKNRGLLDALVNLLLEKETMDGAEIDRLIESCRAQSLQPA